MMRGIISLFAAVVLLAQIFCAVDAKGKVGTTALDEYVWAEDENYNWVDMVRVFLLQFRTCIFSF